MGVIAAGNGYFTVMADYLGMGEGEGFHPYIHARSQATAAIDLSKAAINNFKNIQIDKNMLTVRGERSEEAEETDKTYHRVERHTGTFYRSMTLPQSVNADEVAAEYKDGVLAIHLPKTEDSKS